MNSLFQNNIWNKFLLSCIFKSGEFEQENLIAYGYDGGSLIILSKKDEVFDIRGFDNQTRDFFILKDIEKAYKLLMKAEEINIIKPNIWEEFKRAVVLNELEK